jgi:hypothetical protein
MSNSQQLSFAPVVAENLKHYQLASAASSIVSRRQAEFYPTSSTIYTYNGNNKIEIPIFSGSEFIDTDNSHLRFELRTIGTHDGSNNDFQRSLAEGGAHNLFSSIELRTNQGVLIEKIDEYPKLYNILSNLFDSPDRIQNVEWIAGDSLEDEPSPHEPFRRLTGGWTLTADPTIASAGTDGAATTELKVGDVVIAKTAAGVQVYKGHVVSISSDDSIEVSPAVNASSAVAGDGAILYTQQQPARVSACKPSNTSLDTAGIELNLQPFLGALKNGREYMPLFLMGGVNLVFYLNRPEYAMNISRDQAVSASATLDYQIRNVRYITSMVKPSQQVRAEYQKLYNQGDLKYVFQTFYHSSTPLTGSQGSYNYNLQVAKNSLNNVFFVIQNARANAISNTASSLTDTLTYDANTFIDAGLSNYYVQIGGEKYPQQEINVSDEFMTEAFSHALKSMNKHSSSVDDVRLSPYKWRKINENSDTGAYDSSHKAIFVVSLAKEVGDPAGGMNTKNAGNSIQLVMNFNTEHKLNTSVADRYFHFFATHTQGFSLSAQNGLKVFW